MHRAGVHDATLLTLVEQARTLWNQDLDADVSDAVKALFVDAIAAGLSTVRSGAEILGLLATEVHRARRPAGTFVIGGPSGVDIETAAFVNGSLIRHLDLTDTYLGDDICHFFDNISPLLAVAAARGVTGLDLMRATNVTHEIMGATCDAFAFQQQGALDQGVYHAIAAPIGVGLLMGLDDEKLAHAVSLATASCLCLFQTRRSEVSMWKGCQIPFVSRNVVALCRLAASGMTGPAEPFEGAWGLFRLLPPARREVHVGGIGDQPRRLLLTSKKAYPSNYLAQPAIAAALACRTLLPAAAETADIAEIEVATFDYALAMIDSPAKWHPTNSETADHSTPYVVAIALAFGVVEPEHLTDRFFSDPHVIALLDKMRFAADETASQRYPEHVSARVAVTLTDGSRHEAHAEDPPGHYLNPFTWDELEDRFRAVARGVINDDRAAAAVDLLANLERIPDVARLSGLVSDDASVLWRPEGVVDGSSPR